MQSQQEAAQGWRKRRFGAIAFVAFVVAAILLAGLPVSKIRVTIDNGSGNPAYHTSVLVFVIVDDHLGTQLEMEPGDIVSVAWHVYPGTHRVEVFSYRGIDYQGLSGLQWFGGQQYLNTFKVEILLTKNIDVGVI